MLLAPLGDGLLVPDAASKKNGYKFFGATIHGLEAIKTSHSMHVSPQRQPMKAIGNNKKGVHVKGYLVHAPEKTFIRASPRLPLPIIWANAPRKCNLETDGSQSFSFPQTNTCINREFRNQNMDHEAEKLNLQSPRPMPETAFAATRLSLLIRDS